MCGPTKKVGESTFFIGISLVLCGTLFLIFGLKEAKDEEMIEYKKSQGDDSFKSR